MRSSSEVTALVNAARNGNFNAIIVEVRKRGDAYYNSNFEPKASDVSPQSFDPLADLIAKAHSGGPRIEVHAWITTYLAWNSTANAPPQATHPFNLHPEWLSVNSVGTNFDGANYQFDQAHPEVQKHVYNVAMDIISRYDVDGLQFDYVRYSGNSWGYHPVAVNRFNRRFGRTGTPGSTDGAWLQFRRDQVSDLVRKVYLNTMAVKPQVKISAATICFAPGVTTDAQWYSSSAAWNSVLQDWRGWMEEGILDLVLPMMYFDQDVYANAWASWSIFAKEHAYSRQVVLGQAGYLNSITNTLLQLRSARVPTANSNAADGVALYSYAVPDESLSLATVTNALTRPSIYDPNPVPLFTNSVATPAMPWKTTPTLGHIMGTVRGSASNELDGAVISIAGAVSFARTNDATGFYGFANLLPGNYALTARFSNHLSVTTNVTIAAGVVKTVNFDLQPSNQPPVFGLVIFPGQTEAVIRWNTTVAGDSMARFGLTTNVGDATWRSSWLDPDPVTNHAIFISGLSPNTAYFAQAISRSATNTDASPLVSFSTAGEIILDNAAARLTGSWTIGSSSTDKFSSNYLFAATGSGATATFVPEIATPGLYDVQVWYPQGSNRPTNAPFAVAFDGGTITGVVNQTSGGGGWRTVASAQPFARGTSGYFRWLTSPAEASKVVMADAVRFSYAASQEPTATGSVPRWWGDLFGVNSDADADGFSAADEYLAGTDPLRETSQLVSAIQRGSATVQLEFVPFHEGRVYELLAASTLATNAAWVVVSSAPQMLTNGAGAFILPNAAETTRFYRLRVRLP